MLSIPHGNPGNHANTNNLKKHCCSNNFLISEHSLNEVQSNTSQTTKQANV